jgi:ABC-type Fe3+/spermidine/putrescine transport system ATPase subunit
LGGATLGQPDPHCLGGASPLQGASGSGKSTLRKIMAGLDTPESGSVWLIGQDISDWPPEKRRLALMFQDFALFPHLG